MAESINCLGARFDHYGAKDSGENDAEVSGDSSWAVQRPTLLLTLGPLRCEG